MLTTSKPPFVSPALFRDRNFVTGNVFIFVVGVVLFATLALLPPMLQDLLNYPVVLTGLVTAPRGVGTLAAMFIVGRIMGKVDTRLIIAVGFGLTAVSLWQMTGFYIQMDSASVVWSGLAQGLGTGFVYVPLAAITFATLSPQFRNEGTALFSLVRNVGSSVGISVVETLLTRNTQLMHSRLAEQITPYSDVLHLQPPAETSTTQGLVMLNHSVSDQAAMIAYNNDFKLMMVLTLCAIPLVLLLRSGSSRKLAEPMVIE
jgi:MFS transporter, DHA2 family, multidrug resistance protein